jgi:hypothetical protein
MGTVADTNIYVVGQMVRLATATAFKDANGNEIDPTTIVVKYRKPDGTITTNNAPSHDGVGLFHVDVLIDQPGDWWYRFEGHGNIEVPAVASFFAEPLPL